MAYQTNNYYNEKACEIMSQLTRSPPAVPHNRVFGSGHLCPALSGSRSYGPYMVQLHYSARFEGVFRMNGMVSWTLSGKCHVRMV